MFKHLVLTVLYTQLALFGRISPVQGSAHVKATKVPAWACLYNVGPNADFKRPGVQKACTAYNLKVAAHMKAFQER